MIEKIMKLIKFDEKGLMFDLSLNGAKITKIKR